MKAGHFSSVFAFSVAASLLAGGCVAGDNSDEIDSSDKQELVGYGALENARPGEVIPRYRLILVRSVPRVPSRGLERPTFELQPIDGAPSCSDSQPWQVCQVGSVLFTSMGMATQDLQRYNVRVELGMQTGQTVAYVSGRFIRTGRDLFDFEVSGLQMPFEDPLVENTVMVPTAK